MENQVNEESQFSSEVNQNTEPSNNHLIRTESAFSSRQDSMGLKFEFCRIEGNEILEGKKKLLTYTKYYQKKTGKLQLSAFEQAKELFKNNTKEFAEVKKEEVWGQLQEEEKKKLKKFFDDKKRRLTLQSLEKKEPPKSFEQKLNITEEQQNMISNVYVSRNELISKELCGVQNFDQQVAVMLENHRQNHLAIFDFLKSLQQEPFENFFEVLIEVIQAVEDCTQQVRLLIGLFGIYNGQKLNPKADLCCLALKYLATEDGVISQQVIGFLKFAFITNGDLHKAELQDLVQFDRRHKQCFVGFKQWLRQTFHLPPDLTLVLPNSCYILGLPFAKMLKNRSNILTEHIPSDFLALFIQTLVFSFDEDEELFLAFLDVAKNGFLKLIEKIKTTQLLNLFSGLSEEVQQHNRLWYLNIRNSKRLIEGAFALVKENKVRIFNNEVCKNLLSDLTNIDQYLVAPSLIKSHTNQANDEQIRAFYQLNEQNKGAKKFLRAFDLNQNLSWGIMKNFEVLKITPHFIQELAMKIICQKDYTHSFLNIAPGQGKTKLILAAAIYLVQTTKIPTFVLNSSKTLCVRDFEEATISLEELEIPCASVISQERIITFSTTQDFIDYKENLPEKYHVLLDEYHNIFFNEDKFKGFVEKLKNCESFIGFSGSPLSFVQMKLLQCSFDKQALVLKLTRSTDLSEQETTICKNQGQLLIELSRISVKFRLEAPQIFILDTKTAETLMKGKKNQPYISLIDKDPISINNTLSKLFNKPNDKQEYGTYIINEEMGTGTDFKTSTEIESKGGLVLVFGVKPTNTSTFEQLSCRVGRIFNKSRRFYIIQDATYTASKHSYLNFQLEILKQKENEEARALLSKLKPDIDNAINFSNDKGDDDNDGENSEDIEMENNTLNEDIEITQNEASDSIDENDCEDEYFAPELDNKLQKLKQTQEKGVGKKREQKGIDKNDKQFKKLQKKIVQSEILVQKKTQQKQPANINVGLKRVNLVKLQEECKTCEKECTCVQNNNESDENDRNLDEISSTEQGNMLNIGDQSKMVVEQTQEVVQGSAIEESSKNVGELKVLNPDSKKLKGQKQEVNAINLSKRQAKSLKDNEPLKSVDECYYANYSKEDIHKEMLNDKVRMKAYADAIEQQCKDKIVLDVGSGSGVLSGNAIKSGAREVYGVDKANIKQIMDKQLKKMKVDIKESKFVFVNDTIESAAAKNEIPEVDIVVSEWMGYFLLYENMIGSYIFAIKNFLKPDGVMIPSQANMFISAAAFKGRILPKFKDGFAVTDIIFKVEQLISGQTNIKKIDFMDRKNLVNPLSDGFASDFEITITQTGEFNAFVGSFDTKLCDNILLDTSPVSPQTHWKQSLFFIDKPIQVFEGDVIKGTITVNVDEDNYRNLIVKFTYQVEGKGGSQAEECFTFE